MDKILSLLFDYQSFEQDAELQGIIDTVHARFTSARKLSDSEADLVAAAGQPGAAVPRKKKPGKDPDELL